MPQNRIVVIRHRPWTDDCPVIGEKSEKRREYDEAVIEKIQIDNPALAASPEDERERIGEKVTRHIAKRPAGYSILKLIRPVYMLRSSGKIVCKIAAERGL